MVNKKLITKSLLFFLTISLFLMGTNDVFGQIGKATIGKKNPSPGQDSILTPVAEVISSTDSTTLEKDSTATSVVQSSVKLSKDSLDAPVTYEAKDSMIYDIENQYIYLYGNAQVTYDGMTLNADYIEFDWENSIATAEGKYDSLGNLQVKPVFKDKDNEFTANKMRYNFKTHKGKVYDIRTKEGDGYLLSQGVKFDLRSNKSATENDVVYAESTLYTTCDHDHPHFGIRSNKAKIIPRKLIVVGPSNVEISNVPTPLWLPFGFFPIQQGRRSGVVFPRDYEFDPKLGFGLRNVGYYFAGTEHMDFTVLGEIYTRGSWGLNGTTNYRKRYKYNGSLNLGYSFRRQDYKDTPNFNKQRDFLLRWSHNQDQRAHPSLNFGGSITIGTGSYLRNNRNDAQSVLESTLRSNIGLTKRWLGKPYTLTASFQHSQNIADKTLNIQFPVLDFRVSRIFPFKRTNPGIKKKEQWYEKINFTYTGKAENRISTYDSLLFKSEMLEDLRYGVQHLIPINASFNIAKHFTLTQSIRYQDDWYLNTIEKRFINQNTTDTLGNPVFGTVEEIDRFGFRSQKQISSNSRLSTTLFGMMNLNLKRLKAIRHVMKPSISAVFSPDYSEGPFNYYRTVRNDTQDPTSTEEYNIFDGNIYGLAPRGQQASLNWSINNNFEAKVRSRKDTIQKDKKIPLLTRFDISSGYNFALDSLNFKPVSIGGATKLLKRINVNFGAQYDPYKFVNGKKTKDYSWDIDNKLLDFRSANLTVSTSIKPSEIRNLFFNEFLGTKPEDERVGVIDQFNQSQGFIGALSLTYTLRFSKVFENGQDTVKLSMHRLNLSRTVINLSKNWKINIGNIGYDFIAKRIQYPDFGFYRDLHCWEMGVNTQPERGTFSFFIRVKPGSLDFLNVPYKRDRVSPIIF